jgi:hypothetical protein
VLILARLKQKDFKQELSLEETTTYVILVFLKERKVSNLCNRGSPRNRGSLWE